MSHYEMGHTRTGVAIIPWPWPSQASSGHRRQVSLERRAELLEAEPGPATCTTEGGRVPLALGPRAADSAPLLPGVGETLPRG